MRAWILAIVLVAGCKGSKGKEATRSLPAPKVGVATVLAKTDERPPFVLFLDDAGTVRLGAAKTWADVDAGTLTIAKRATTLDDVDRYVREAYGLQKDPVDAVAAWDKVSDTDIDLASLEDPPPSNSQDDPPPPPPEDMADDGSDESGGTGTAMNIDESKLVHADADRAEGQYKMKRTQEDPQLARQQAIEQARAAGILGKASGGGVGAGVLGPGRLNDDGTPSRVAQIAGAVTAKIERLRAMIVIAPTAKATKLIDAVHATGAAIAVAQDGKLRPLNLDFDVRDSASAGRYWLEARLSTKGIVVEAVPDKVIEVQALDQLGAAIGKARDARGADADAPVDVLVDADVDAQRLVDVVVALEAAGVKSIGMGAAPSADELARRGHRIRAIRVGQPNAQGDLDKAVIRRVVKGALAKIGACYDSALAGDPSLGGTVQTQFFIKPDGKVATATSAGVSEELAKCVEGVFRSLEFPKPNGGGGVQVNYPITMHM